MNVRRRLILLVTVLVVMVASASSALAAPFTVNYERSIFEGDPLSDQGLPVFLSGSPNNVRFRYFVPDFSFIKTLISVTVSVDLYDDGDNPNTEEADLLFVLNGIGLPNLLLNSRFGLNGFTSASRFTLSATISGADLANVLAEIQDDGVFFLRVNRNAQDFFVTAPSVTIDAVPEPRMTWLVAVTALAGLCRWRARR